MASLLISNPVQVVEDRAKSEKLQGSKKPDAQIALRYPIPNLRRRTSVAYSKRNSNDVRSLYDGTNGWSVCGDESFVKRGIATRNSNTKA